jgi:hemerythrin
MPLIRWSRHLELGIYVFDAEHMQLLGLVNDLYDAIFDDINPAAVAAVVTGMGVFIARHSAHEEKFFHVCGYPDAEAHIAEHRRLSRDIARFRHRQGCAAELAYDLNTFLLGWFTDHILGRDRDYCEHLRKIGIR